MKSITYMVVINTGIGCWYSIIIRIPERIKMIPNPLNLVTPNKAIPMTPFWEGEADFPSTENRYLIGTPEHEEWKKGWEHAKVSTEAW